MRGWVAMWALVALVLSSGLARAGSDTIQWKGQKVDLAAPPTGFPAHAAAGLARWESWANEAGLKLVLEPQGRAVVVLGRTGSPSRWLKLLDAVFKRLDEHVPLLEKSAASGAGAPPPSRKGGVVPEDPEGARPGAAPATSGAHEPDTELVLMFVLDDEERAAATVQQLAKLEPYLASWAEHARGYVGFALESPLAGAVVLSAAGQKEWDPENEFVHRAAELALLRRVGRLPYWALQGWAWQVELSVCRGLYCFPYRAGFVGIGEHSGWDKRLVQDHADGSGPTQDELFALRRGTWDERAARHAWGAYVFLEKYRADRLGETLRGLHAAWDKGSRRDLGAGRWERDPQYEVPAAEVRKALEEHCGVDVIEEMARSCRQGSTFKPAR